MAAVTDAFILDVEMTSALVAGEPGFSILLEGLFTFTAVAAVTTIVGLVVPFVVGDTFRVEGHSAAVARSALLGVDCLLTNWAGLTIGPLGVSLCGRGGGAWWCGFLSFGFTLHLTLCVLIGLLDLTRRRIAGRTACRDHR